jgi:NitT/TauT family transport system substrate-binding protein
MGMARLGRDWIIGVLTLALVAGCERRAAESGGPAAGGEAKLVDVTLQLNWFPEAEHGGFFAALVHGDYRAAGLNVKIISGGPDTPVVQQVARRAVTFGVVNADNVLFGRAQQAPVVALMAPLQISPRCLIVHESSGIRDFEQLKDMTIAMSTSNAFSHYLRYKLPLTNVKIVPYSGNVAQFLLNKDYAQQGYVFSEPYVARKEGGDPRVLMVSDLGFNPYTSLLFTHAKLVDEDPKLVAKMVAASVRGWQRYLRASEETNRYIHEVNPQMDLDILAYGAKTIEPLVLDPVAEREGIGTMSAERWRQLADQLVESGQLKREDAGVEGAYTTRFLTKEE